MVDSPESVSTTTVSHVIVSVLALALVVGLSPLPVIPAMLLLTDSGGLANARAYLFAWLIGLTSLIGVAVLIGGLGEPYADAEQSAGWLEIVVGGLLLLAAVIKVMRSRKAGGQPKEPPAWQAALDSYGTGQSARLGFLFAIGNPKNLAAAFAAGAEIALLSPSVATSLVAVTAFVVIGSLGVATPIVAAWVLGTRADDVLAWLRSFLERRGTAVSVGVLVVLGAVLLARGLIATF